MSKTIFIIISFYKVICYGNEQLKVCDATKQLYQDFSCCGGTGHSVCTSEQFNVTQLTFDIKNIINDAVERITMNNNMETRIPTTVFEACVNNMLLIMDTLA